jgi:hypothetical protein
MEPLMASLIAYIMLHAGLLPVPLDWLGNLLVVIGTFTVAYHLWGKEVQNIYIDMLFWNIIC